MEQLDMVKPVTESGSTFAPWPTRNPARLNLPEQFFTDTESIKNRLAFPLVWMLRPPRRTPLRMTDFLGCR